MQRERRTRFWSMLFGLALAAGEVIKYWDVNRVRRLDFNIYYEAVTSRNLYDYLFPGFDLGFTYPTGAALFMSPFTWFGHGFAQASWLLVSMLCAIVTFVGIGSLLVRQERLTGVAAAVLPWGMVAGGLLTMPTFLTIRYGQINLFIGAMVFVDLWAVVNRKKWAGIGIGVAAAIKLTPLLFVPILLVQKRTRRAAMTMLVSFAGFTGLAYLARPGDTKRYWTEMISKTERIGPMDSPINRSVRRIIAWTHLGERPETLMWVVATALIVGLVVLASRKLIESGRIVDWFVLIVATSYVVSPITWGHHMTYLAPILAVAWFRFSDARGRAFFALGVVLAVDPFGFGHGRFSSFFQTAWLTTFVVALGMQAIKSSGGVAAAAREFKNGVLLESKDLATV